MARTRLVLYGGVNEIGGNKFLLEEGEDRLLLDFGTSIGARNEFYEEFLKPRTNSALRDLLRLGLLPGVDGLYRDDLLEVAKAATDKDLPSSAADHRARHGGRDFVQGILITHAHVDHFQDLSFVDPDIPVFCTPTTHRMLEAIEDVKKDDVQGEILTTRWRSIGESGPKALFPGSRTVETEPRPRAFRLVEEGRSHAVGNFEVVPIPVDHSVPGGVAFFIRTPRGRRVLYTGDVRFHGRLMDRTASLRKAVDNLEPDVLLSEGTRMGSDAADSEEDVERGVAELAREADGKLVVAEFAWKDSTRFDTLQRVAEATGRTLLIDPRLAVLLRRLDDREDVPSRRIEAYPNVKAYVRRTESMLDEPGDYTKAKHGAGYLTDWGDRNGDFKRAVESGDDAYVGDALAFYRHGVRARDVAANPGRFMVHLTFFSVAELLDLDPPRGSRWIRCSTEPYSDEMAMDLEKQRRWLSTFGMDDNIQKSRRGVGVAEDGALVAPGRTTHISGHGAGIDLKTLIRSIRPRNLVPIHTREESLDHFQALGFATTTFAGKGYRNAGRGECVVEI